MNTIKHRAENLNNGGSVTVYYCGYEKCEGGHFWGPAVRNQYLLHYVISGKGTYTVGEETYTLHANECFLIRPGEPHILHCRPRRPVGVHVGRIRRL